MGAGLSNRTRRRRHPDDRLRHEWGRLLALLAARFRPLDLAEDGLAEAFEAAARTWAEPPANPAAWLLVAAQRRITDRLRAEAAPAYDDAIARCANEAERAYLDERRAALDQRRPDRGR